MTDSNVSFSSNEAALTHYRTLVDSLQSQLDEANTDIKDFTESSRELQDELEQELLRMEKSEKEMRKFLDESKNDTEEWKSKYTNALKDHTKTISHMQTELESLRASEKTLRTKLRDMELDNDDLEKAEREKDSSLQDLENRYGKSIERIALLEEELVHKAQLDEEVQRLKDELRDLHEEMGVIRTQAQKTYPPAYPRQLTPPNATTLPSNVSNGKAADEEDVFNTPKKAVAQIDSATTTTNISPNSDSPSEISLVSSNPVRKSSLMATGIPSPQRPRYQSMTSPPSAAAVSLARSNKTLNLASAQNTTPKAVREKRSDTMVKDMRDMTNRVRQITSRLDSRRNIIMAGSGIPRASMSPGGVPAGMKRSETLRKLTSSKIGVNSFVRPSSRQSNFSSEPERISTRPSSRSGMRSSIGFNSGAAGRSGLPIRPSSRMSNLSVSTNNSNSRPVTPSGRAPTPISSRPAWGAPNVSNITTSTSHTNALAQSQRRRSVSTAAAAADRYSLSKSTNHRNSSDLSQSTRIRPPSRNSHTRELPPPVPNLPSTLTANKGDRRVSLLGRSLLRTPSGKAA